MPCHLCCTQESPSSNSNKVDMILVSLAGRITVTQVVFQSALLCSAARATLGVSSEYPILQCNILGACTKYFQHMQTYASLNSLVNVKKQAVIRKLCFCQLSTTNVYLL